MGDGAGILIQIPDEFYRAEMASQGVTLPSSGKYGVGMIFLPKEHASRRAATVLTSNLDFSEWGEAFASNKMIGAATLDRLRHGAYRVVLEGESYRSRKPLPQTPKTTVAKHEKIAHR